MGKLEELVTTCKALSWNHPEPITARQLKKLLADTNALTKNRDVRLKFVSLMIGRTVLSMKELKKGEAMTLLDEDLPALFNELKDEVLSDSKNVNAASEWGVIRVSDDNETPEDYERKILRQKAVNDRRVIRGHTRCDYCDIREGSEYHEIIPRSHLPSKSQHRIKIYQPEVCSWTCHECHMNVAATPMGRHKGLLSLCKLYGYFKVYSVFTAIPDRFRVGINFPDYSDFKGE